MKIAALMMVRNEEAYLPRTLERLAAQGIRVAAIDHGSTDASARILASFAPRTVICVEHEPFTGTFGMVPLLKRMAEMQRRIDADWLLLNSADEAFYSDRAGETLPDAIRRVDAAGYNAINFDEFVFIPEDAGVSYENRPFDTEMRHYYFHEPAPLRQMRAWKNIPGLSNVDDAGHRLRGPDIRLYPANMNFRHFITLSVDHFRRKYEGRTFPADELARGWHHNRANLDPALARLPPRALLKHLADDHPASYDRTAPWKHHFWELDRGEVSCLEKRRTT